MSGRPGARVTRCCGITTPPARAGSAATGAAINESAETTDRYSRDIIRARGKGPGAEQRYSPVGDPGLRPERGGQGLHPPGQYRGQHPGPAGWKSSGGSGARRKTATSPGSSLSRNCCGWPRSGKRWTAGFCFCSAHTAGGLVPFKLQAIDVDELDSGRTPAPPQGQPGGGRRGVQQLAAAPGLLDPAVWTSRGGGSWSRSTSTPGTPFSSNPSAGPASCGRCPT